MIKAVIFDLDGTLIQTEVLKATSYARAIQHLTRGEVSEAAVMDVFGQFVGLSRAEVVKGLSRHYEAPLTRHLKSSDPHVLQENVIEKRLTIYREILDDTKLLSRHFCTFTLGLLQRLQADNFKTVLATMSHLPEAKKITSIMGIYKSFDLFLTREDVVEGKPNPEIYTKACKLLGLKTSECLVIEDSVNGILAGQNAGMTVFAVTNSVTRTSVHDCKLLPPDFIVDQLEDLIERVYAFITTQE